MQILFSKNAECFECVYPKVEKLDNKCTTYLDENIKTHILHRPEGGLYANYCCCHLKEHDVCALENVSISKQ